MGDNGVIYHNSSSIITTTTNSTIIDVTSTTTITTTIVTNRPITPDIVIWYLRLIVYGILCQIMSVFGTITNAINIVVFLKLGVRKDPMNVSLLGLSVSDFVSCLTVIYVNLCMTPGFTENQNLPFTPIGTHLLFSAWPHAICVKITILITAFITIERCLCVTYPLKIKSLFTPKRVAFIIAIMYLSMIFLTAPIYHMFRMKWVFFPSRNRSVYTLIFHEDRDKFEPPLYTIFSLIVPFTAYFATILSTIVLVHNLKKMAKWRSSVTTSSATSTAVKTQPSSSTSSSSDNNSASKNSQINPRDAKVAKMVAVISTLYISCYLPVTAAMLASLSVFELREGGAYQNTLYAIFSVVYLLESTNAALNIFIYLTMSTNYKTMFQSIFSKGKTVDD